MKVLAVIKTKYATIEQLFPDRYLAFQYIKEAMNNYEVVAYEVKTLREV